jgi:hypothetical protein
MLRLSRRRPSNYAEQVSHVQLSPFLHDSSDASRQHAKIESWYCFTIINIYIIYFWFHKLTSAVSCYLLQEPVQSRNRKPSGFAEFLAVITCGLSVSYNVFMCLNIIVTLSIHSYRCKKRGSIFSFIEQVLSMRKRVSPSPAGSEPDVSVLSHTYYTVTIESSFLIYSVFL